jgi:hypothetical protein
MLVEYKISLVSLQQNNLLECNSDGFANPRVSLRLSLNYLKPKLTNFSLFLFFSQCFESDFYIFFATASDFVCCYDFAFVQFF